MESNFSKKIRVFLARYPSFLFYSAIFFAFPEFSAPRIKLSRLLTTPEDPNAGPQLQGVNQGFQTADTNSPGTHPQLNTGAQIQQLSPSLRRGSAPAIGDFTPAYNTIWSPTENLGAPPGTFAMQPSSSGSVNALVLQEKQT